MTTSLIEAMENKPDIPAHKPVELFLVGKEYRFLNKTGHNDLKDRAQEFWALKDVSFEVPGGRILGVIGRNGAGKTTLLNIISGTLSPTEGRVKITGRVLGLFNLGVGFQDELTGKENIFLNGAILGASRKELDGKLKRIIEFSELGDFINMPLGTYSQGMRLRLGFSIIANLDCDILVIDEILAVGDLLFQNKCFERLMEFKRLGKTLIISSQSMDLIERLCDRVVLLAHGRVSFMGEPLEAVTRYRDLLSSEQFFVGPDKREIKLVEDTKKWTDDISSWGMELGTKEVVINKVEFINWLGWECSKVKSGRPLRIKVKFSAKNNIKEPHFGIAIFREDGVYCYGPNTKFDRHDIPELKAGKGVFTLDYHSLLLAGGEYRVSIAIWDKNETIAYAYNHGCYRLVVEGGRNSENQLINMPYCCSGGKRILRDLPHADLGILKELWGGKIIAEETKIRFVRLLDRNGREGRPLFTNEPAKLEINLSGSISCKGNYLWIGIFRQDRVYCQGIMLGLNNRNSYTVTFPEFSLLPGGYAISVGIWDQSGRKFIICDHGTYPFRVVFSKEDHGTIYLKHKWSWKLP